MSTSRWKLFLGLTTLMALLLLLLGAWDFRVSGAVHEVILGVVMLALIGVAAIWWSRLPP